MPDVRAACLGELHRPGGAAPLLAAWFAIIAACLVRLGATAPAGRPIGRIAVAAVIAFTIIGASRRINQARQLNAVNVGLMRAALVEELSAGAAPNELVIMRYLPGHQTHHEWVYNDAEIDKSPVVWARDLGEEKNAELLRYFSGRRKWLVEFPAPLEEPVRSGKPWRQPQRLL